MASFEPRPRTGFLDVRTPIEKFLGKLATLPAPASAATGIETTTQAASAL